MRLAVPREVIESARDARGDGMERLLQMLWPHAFRIARSIVQNDALAEDAAQEACALIYRQIAQLRNAEAFRVWTYRIVVREALRLAKRETVDAGTPSGSMDTDIDARLDIVRALSQLPRHLRAVIVLHYYAELSSSEIGDVLGIPSPTVRFRLARARQRLKHILFAQETTSMVVEVSQ